MTLDNTKSPSLIKTILLILQHTYIVLARPLNTAVHSPCTVDCSNEQRISWKLYTLCLVAVDDAPTPFAILYA